MDVICRVCGKTINKDTAFCMPNTRPVEYCCNLEEYKMKLKYNRCLNLVKETYVYCLGENLINFGMVVKEINEMIAQYSEDKITVFINKNKDKLFDTIRRHIDKNGKFQNKYGAIRYLTKVITSQLDKMGDVVIPESKPTSPIFDQNLYSIYNESGAPKTQRRSLEDLENLYGGNK